MASTTQQEKRKEKRNRRYWVNVHVKAVFLLERFQSFNAVDEIVVGVEEMRQREQHWSFYLPSLTVFRIENTSNARKPSALVETAKS